MTNDKVLPDLAMLMGLTVTVTSLQRGIFRPRGLGALTGESRGQSGGSLLGLVLLPPRPVVGRLQRTPWPADAVAAGSCWTLAQAEQDILSETEKLHPILCSIKWQEFVTQEIAECNPHIFQVLCYQIQ